MASQAYQANMNKKKEKQAEEVWKKIKDNDQLKGLIQLHEEIKNVEKFRKDNRDYMDTTNQNYQLLKDNIKTFIRAQNIDKKKRWYGHSLSSFSILFLFM